MLIIIRYIVIYWHTKCFQLFVGNRLLNISVWLTLLNNRFCFCHHFCIRLKIAVIDICVHPFQIPDEHDFQYGLHYLPATVGSVMSGSWWKTAQTGLIKWELSQKDGQCYQQDASEGSKYPAWFSVRCFEHKRNQL